MGTQKRTKRIATPTAMQALRARREWTQADLAREIGQTEKNVQALESGRRKLTESMSRLLTFIDRFGRLE